MILTLHCCARCKLICGIERAADKRDQPANYKGDVIYVW